MSREVTVVTPENVTISYELAGIGTRALAYLWDLLLQGAIMLALLIVGGLALSGLTSAYPDSWVISRISDCAVAIYIIISFLMIAVYFVYFEGTKNGQTPGKRLLGIRVIRERGAPIDMAAAAIRNLIRMVEMGFFYYAVSIVTILFSQSYKRIGDYAAGTIVVKERGNKATVPEVPVIAEPVSQGFSPPYEDGAGRGLAGDGRTTIANVHLVTKDQLLAVRRFAERRGELTLEVQNSVAEQIALPIMARLGMPQPGANFNYIKFLEDVYSSSVNELGMM